MPQSANSDKPVNYRGVPLPAELFTFQSRDGQAISPASILSPVGALEGQPWAASAAPSAEPKPKTLIITKEWKASFTNLDELYVMLFWLHTLGFKQYLFCISEQTGAQPALVEFKPAQYGAEPPENLYYLASHRPEKITECYEAAQLSLDHTQIIESKIWQEVLNAVNAPSSNAHRQQILFKPVPVLHKIENFQELITYLRCRSQDSQEQRDKLIKDHQDKIENIYQLAQCLEYCSPELQVKLITDYHDKIQDGSQLALCLQYCSPELQVKLITDYHDKIQDGFQLALCLQCCSPKLRDKLINDYHDKIQTGYQLARCLEYCSPELQDRLIKEHQYKIQDGYQLARCLQYCSPELQDRLIKDLQHKIDGKYLANYLQYCSPELQDRLIKEYQHKIQNGSQLADYLEYCSPELQAELIKEHQHKIQNAFHLAQCLQYCSAELQAELIKEHQHKIQNGSQLAGCLPDWPAELRAELIDEHQNKIQTARELARCLAFYPEEHQLTLLEQWLGKKNLEPIDMVFILGNLAPFLRKNFYHNRQLNPKTPELYYQLLSIDERLFSSYCSSLTSDKARITFEIAKYPSRHRRQLSYIQTIVSGDMLLSYILSRENPCFRAQILHALDWSDEEILKTLVPSREPPISQTQFVVRLCVWAEDSPDFQRLLAKIENGEYPSLAYVEIHGGNEDCIQQLINAFEQHCAATIRHIELPAGFSSHTLSSSIYQPFHFPNLKNTETQNAAAVTMLQQSAEANSPRFNPPNKNALYIDQANSMSAFDASMGSTAHFQYIDAGEVLNPCGLEPQCVRTSIIQRDLTQSLEQSIYNPAKLEPQAINQLKQNQLDNFKQARIDNEGRYYYFRQTLQPGLNRLLSIDPHEIMMGFVDTAVNELNLFKGDDDFYYVEASKTMACAYVVKAQTEEQIAQRYAELPNNSAIKQVIDTYKSEEHGYRNASSANTQLPLLENGNIPDWLEKMYDFRGGSCAHRAAALEHKLRKQCAELNGPPNQLRVVCIDNDHDRLEIFTEKTGWISIDAGGGGDYEASFLPKQETYCAAAAASHPEASKPRVKGAPANQIVPKSEPAAVSPVSVKPKSSKKSKLAAHLATHVVPEKFDNEMAMALIHGHDKKIAFVTSTPEEHAAALLAETRKTPRTLFFVLESPKEIALDKSSIGIDNRDDKASIWANSYLMRFLNYITQQRDLTAKLIIRWDNFSASEQVALNTLLDKQRTLNGIRIPDNLQIIGLYKEAPKNSALFSRYDIVAAVPSLVPETATNPSGAKVTPIDNLGFPDWQAQLFGPLVLENNQVVWHKSAWVSELETIGRNSNANTVQHRTFQIRHLPEQAITAFQRMMQQARAVGYINYHNKRIPLSENVSVTLDTGRFDFSPFKKINIHTNAVNTSVPTDAKLINSELFDYLLHHKQVGNKGQYQHLLGWLEEHKNRELELWITSPLSESQWYCLLTEAEQLNVQLRLYLAPGVEAPLSQPPANTTDADAAAPTRTNSANLPALVLTNNADTYWQQMPKMTNPTIIDVEDASYQSLIEAITFKQDKEQFSDFTVQQSELLERFTDSNQTIILKGKFAPELLQALHPLLAGRPIQLADGRAFTCLANLTCLIEVDATDLPQQGQPYQPLSFVSEQVQSCYCPVQATIQPVLYEEQPPFANVSHRNHPFEGSEAKTHAFMNQRLGALRDALNDYNLIRLTGPTGVGKSYLMQALQETQSKDTIVYHGLDKLAEWAAATDAGKQAILFLDEVNILDKHLTFLNPLKQNQDDCEIFYQGKFYRLGSHHKVVVALNEASYGGGRQQQKLFADNQVPSLKLTDFPDYVYYHWLKSSLQGRKIDEQRIQKKLQKYLNENSEARRQGIEGLDKLRYKILKKTLEQNQPLPADVLPSSQPIWQELRTFIQLHQLNLPSLCQIPHGFNIQGSPGTGKSTLVEKALSHAGLPMIKIEASLPRAKKEALIIYAFEQGTPILIDELNSCADEGIEAVLNSALSGIHPRTGQPSTTPGFKAFFTGNSAATTAGLSVLSPALQRRCVQVNMALPTADDVKVVIRQAGQFNSNIENQLAEDFASLMQDNPVINLRILENHLNEIWAIYKDKNSNYKALIESNSSLFQKDSMRQEQAGTNPKTIEKNDLFHSPSSL